MIIYLHEKWQLAVVNTHKSRTHIPFDDTPIDRSLCVVKQDPV